jgi:hypothetical protein
MLLKTAVRSPLKTRCQRVARCVSSDCGVRSVAQGAQPHAQHLGLLYPTEEHGVYGYITNTKIKFVVVTDGDVEPSESSVKHFFQRIHELYSNAVCNPFHTSGGSLNSTGFGLKLEMMLSRTQL